MASVCVIAIVIGCLLPESSSERIKEEHKKEAPGVNSEKDVAENRDEERTPANVASDDAAKLLDCMEMSPPEMSEQRESAA